MCYLFNMGRGGRKARTLALNPAPPTYDQDWLTSLITFDRNVHGTESTSCDIPQPYGAPHFVVMGIPYLGAVRYLEDTSNSPHTFRYHEIPEEMLTEFVSTIRTPARSKVIAILERRLGEFKFISAYLSGDVKCFTSPCIRQSFSSSAAQIKERIRRVHAISAAHKQTAINSGAENLEEYPFEAATPAYTGKERFLFSVQRISEAPYLLLAESLEDVKEVVWALCGSPSAFVNLYDLDVSGQPVPVRFTVRYAIPDGTVQCEVTEAT